jgi:hypothetical protein
MKRPEVDCKRPGRRADDVGAEAGGDDSRDRPVIELGTTVDPGGVAVPEDVTGIGEDEAAQAKRKPGLIRLANGLEELVEVGHAPDQPDDPDRQDAGDDRRDQRLAAWFRSQGVGRSFHSRAIPVQSANPSCSCWFFERVGHAPAGW